VHKVSGVEVAVKVFDKSQMVSDEYRKKRVFQEIYIMKKLRHRAITKVLEVFETHKYLAIVMEYVRGGDLLNLVKVRGRLHEGDAKHIFKQIVVGLAYMHCRSVAHRDIKLDNFLLTKDGKIKICDFGVSRIYKKFDHVTD